ncbi:hypothetical protein Xedl_03570 [Xenorhabdus eapokensis]|uniref:Uncharacterized protein n=1 Tax=Xenorhabdus eapokensis TaxID=1873482 RepID=A0A1Q5THH1_9GAMM|nr:hypothetical protein Xedl_03570 [Xenorhabdus eapokensis]
METKITPKYTSLYCDISKDLRDEFIDRCKEAGIDASTPMCFSVEPIEFVRIIHDGLAKIAISLLDGVVMRNFVQ